MKNITIYILILSCFLTMATAQSALIAPGSIGVPNVANNPTCNTAAKGNQVYNTTANKMYFCNGTSWVDMTVGGFTLPYSGSGSTVSHLFALSNSSGGAAFYAENTGNGRAIYGKSVSNVGIRGESSDSYGVSASSNTSTGLYGSSISGLGIHAFSASSIGLYVEGNGSDFSAYISGNSKVTTKLAIGTISYGDVNARLHIKGLDTGDWGQHIRMEDKDSDNYGDILYDGAGMKFRTFRLGDEFIFRNSANTTIATIGSDIYANKDVNVNRDVNVTRNINTTGNINTDGNINANGNVDTDGFVTVQNNYGIVRSQNATQLKVVRTTVALSGTSIGVGAYVDSNDFGYSSFSSAPIVTVGQINESSSTGEWYKVIIVPFDVTATTCKFRLFNSANTAITFTATWSLSIVGPQ